MSALILVGPGGRVRHPAQHRVRARRLAGADRTWGRSGSRRSMPTSRSRSRPRSTASARAAARRVRPVRPNRVRRCSSCSSGCWTMPAAHVAVRCRCCAARQRRPAPHRTAAAYRGALLAGAGARSHAAGGARGGGDRPQARPLGSAPGVKAGMDQALISSQGLRQQAGEVAAGVAALGGRDLLRRALRPPPGRRPSRPRGPCRSASRRS